LASQALWLAALLALRQAGAGQYFWCRALRRSARNNSPQNRHFCSFARAMAHPPHGPSWRATALCHTHHKSADQERNAKKEEDEKRGRRTRTAFRNKPSKKIDEENPSISHCLIQAGFRSPLTIRYWFA
jgi:hypothetical protein